MLALFTTILGPFKKVALIALGVLAVAFGLYYKGRKDANHESEVKATKRAYVDLKKRQEVEDTLRGNNVDDRERLRRKWTRPGSPD